jgi:hypothetical protein
MNRGWPSSIEDSTRGTDGAGCELAMTTQSASWLVPSSVKSRQRPPSRTTRSIRVW